MSMDADDIANGTNIRGQTAYLDTDPSQAAVIVSVYPIPAGELENGLMKHLMAAAREYLKAQGVIGEDFVDVGVKAPMQ